MPVMRLCNYRLINAIVFLIKMLVECKYYLFEKRSLQNQHKLERYKNTIKLKDF